MSEDATPKPPASKRDMCESVFRTSLVGGLLLYLAHPPLAWSVLGWIAPCAWLWVAKLPQLAGRRPYLRIWAASFLFWIAMLHWIRLAHPATIFGAILLSGYLAVYLPLFVLVVRQGLAMRLPLWLVAPPAWVATEWMRNHFLGGFPLGAVGHTQINVPQVVQIADLGGAYLVSGMMLLTACALTELIAVAMQKWARCSGIEIPWRRAALATTIATVAVCATMIYGELNLPPLRPDGGKRIALVQGSHKAVWTSDPDRNKRVMATYVKLTYGLLDDEVAAGTKLDLIVWPEGMFRMTELISYASDFQFPSEMQTSPEEQVEVVHEAIEEFVKSLNTPLLVGIDRLHFRTTEEGERYDFDLFNSAIAVRRDGQIVGVYDKVHRVMFGEYVPLGDTFPAINGLFPIATITRGEGPKVFTIDGVNYMPTICFESLVPHLVRQQFLQLTAKGTQPDVLVNITNDSWFDASPGLEMHLTSTRMRAIECRVPIVVASNGGYSASIDRSGRVLGKTGAQTEETLVATVDPGSRITVYTRYGDVVAVASVAMSLLVLVLSWKFAPRSAPTV